MQATQETGAVIAVERLVKCYRRAQHNAVDGLSFQVRRGEIFGFRATLEKLPGITKVELLRGCGMQCFPPFTGRNCQHSHSAGYCWRSA